VLVIGSLGLVLVALAAAAFVAERTNAVRQRRPMRSWFVATDVVGGLFGVLVAIVAFTAVT